MTKTPINAASNDDFEVSRTVAADKVVQKGTVSQKFTATEEECGQLAQRLGVVAVHRFEGDVKIAYVKPNRSYLVSGSFSGEVTQECRTTFAPIRQVIEDNFEETLVTQAQDLPSVEEALESEQAVEILQNDVIDYGEIATQWLSLTIDPYPRAEGQLFEHIEEKQEKTNPFSVLKSVKLQNNDKK